jgi:hypothetical protein
LAVEYEQVVGRPLGVTGELAELEAARILGLTPLEVRHPGADAVDARGKRIQIKGRKLKDGKQGMTGMLKATAACDAVVLVLFDDEFRATQIWQADYRTIDRALRRPGSKGRNVRRQLAVSKFRALGTRVWPVADRPA